MYINILVPQQSGSRKGIFTEDVAYKLTDNVLKCINQNNGYRGNFCDLEKAFEFVNHDVLLCNLHFYGIQ
jgi:hypothetical protein